MKSRLRVTRACDRCKKRKIRCDGIQPCETCSEGCHPCAYTAPYTRGRQPTRIRKAQEINRPVSSPSVADDGLDDQSPSRPTPVELAITDLDGHFLGPASEAAFLLRVQRSLTPHHHHKLSSHISLAFSLSDEPLSLHDAPLRNAVPQEEKAAQLVQIFFDQAMPIGHFIDRATVESWVADLHDPPIDYYSQSSTQASRNTLLHSMFAVAHQHMACTLGGMIASKSQPHFAAAELYLNQRQLPTNLTIIQTRLCQCIWLLGESRVSHCGELLGVVARQALAIGLHRTGASLRLVSDIDACRRTFWCLYALDVYVSIALGRPRALNDHDIMQEFPGLGDGMAGGQWPSSPPGGSVREAAMVQATLAYFRLSRIIGKVLQDIYTSEPPPITELISPTKHHLERLQDWQDGFCSTIPTQESEPSSQSPSAPASPPPPLRDFLDLLAAHATILVTRPFLLLSLAAATGARRRTSSSSCGGHHIIDEAQAAAVAARVAQCKAAAMRIAEILSDVDQAQQLVRLLWFTPFIALSAITVLYSGSLTTEGSGPSQPDSNNGNNTCFSAATRCQAVLFRIVRDDSLAAKNALLLEELRSQV
ncbi:fungal-specific transcription factor domain-containing protein [Aspergillus pseudoustus]|uniref:Fungal-specific transcription factor domain-containing protein n=1 Tax=Aspergillus pseudoustus TaxID=1810923 RepID=A0ABR4JNZ9_9EURO